MKAFRKLTEQARKIKRISRPRGILGTTFLVFAAFTEGGHYVHIKMTVIWLILVEQQYEIGLLRVSNSHFVSCERYKRALRHTSTSGRSKQAGLYSEADHAGAIATAIIKPS